MKKQYQIAKTVINKELRSERLKQIQKARSESKPKTRWQRITRLINEADRIL